MSKIKLLSAATIVFGTLFGGCVSHGVMVSEEQISKIIQGSTTESAVLASLGQPTSIGTSNGRRVLVYSGAYAQPRATTFIPIVGPLVGGADIRASSVVITITNGVVSDISSTHTTSASGIGLAAGAPITQVQDQPRK